MGVLEIVEYKRNYNILQYDTVDENMKFTTEFGKETVESKS